MARLMMTAIPDPADSFVVDNAECIESHANTIRVRHSGKLYWVPRGALHKESEVRNLGDKGKLVVTMRHAVGMRYAGVPEELLAWWNRG